MRRQRHGTVDQPCSGCNPLLPEADVRTVALLSGLVISRACRRISLYYGIHFPKRRLSNRRVLPYTKYSRGLVHMIA